MNQVVVKQKTQSMTAEHAQVNAQIYQMFLSGIALKQIARNLGISINTVRQRVRPFQKIMRSTNPDMLQAFADNRKDLLNSVELQTLQSLADPEKHKKATLNQTAYTLQQITNARRLEEGKSTANTAISIQEISIDKFK